MSAENPIILPRKFGSSQYVIPAGSKQYSGGNNVFQYPVTKFLYTGEGKVFGSRTLPSTLDNAQSAVVVAVVSLIASGQSGEEVRTAFAYRSIDPRAGTPESLDPSAAQETVAVSTAVNAWVAKDARVIEYTLTASNLAGEDQFDYYLQRDPAHADDDHDSTLFVHALYLLATY